MDDGWWFCGKEGCRGGDEVVAGCRGGWGWMSLQSGDGWRTDGAGGRRYSAQGGKGRRGWRLQCTRRTEGADVRWGEVSRHVGCVPASSQADRRAGQHVTAKQAGPTKPPILCEPVRGLGYMCSLYLGRGQHGHCCDVGLLADTATDRYVVLPAARFPTAKWMSAPYHLG